VLPKDLSDVKEGDRAICARRGDAGVLGAPHESTEPPSDRLSTSSEFDSSMTDRMLGDPPSAIMGAGAAKFCRDGRTGRAYDGIGPLCCEDAVDSDGYWGLLYSDALSNDEGESDRGNGK
jgi:hypothetical protein